MLIFLFIVRRMFTAIMKCHYLVFILLVNSGDIAFRFLKFVENEESFRALHSGARFDIDVAAEVRAAFTLT